MNLSPTAASRRSDRLLLLVIAGNLLLLGVLAGLAGLPMGLLGSVAAGVMLVSAWLGLSHSGSAVSAWGLSLLLAGTALGGVMLLPQQPALLANLLLVGSLLPAYRRWGLVLAAGLSFAAVPWLAGVHDAQPGTGAVMTALLLAQTGLLVVVARRDDAQAREAFDIDFLVRAMGREGAIRLDMGVLKAETPLGQRLKQAQERVAGVLQQLRHSARSATEAAAALQASGHELTERSQHAGAELGAAAMTLTQIAVIVKDSATAAMTARETAQVATRMAEDGGQIVGRMVGQMRDIDASARRITDIIRTIESIAFQTNMLALNAAVEAARAGEQGRGFAVVAGEVRALAQRAAAASGEVKQLVNDALASVAQGNALAAEVGQTISELTATVARVDETFHTLADDTNEHAAGIEAIRDTMNDLNRATQDNLRLAEQSQGIASDLAARAASLTEALSGFRLGAETVPAGPVAPLGAGVRPAAPRAPAAALAPRPATPAPAAAPAPAPARAPAAARASVEPASQADNVEFF